jgi:hypothetical protein
MFSLLTYCNFKPHVKSSWHSLIPFPSLILQLPIPKTRINSIPLLPSSYPGRLASWNLTLHSRLNYTCSLLDYFVPSSECVLFLPLGTDHTENTAFIVKEVCLMISYLTLDVLMLHAYASWKCVLPSRCLVMGIHITICNTFTIAVQILLDHNSILDDQVPYRWVPG